MAVPIFFKKNKNKSRTYTNKAIQYECSILRMELYSQIKNTLQATTAMKVSDSCGFHLLAFIKFYRLNLHLKPS